jgi:hypothetical protein
VLWARGPARGERGRARRTHINLFFLPFPRPRRRNHAAGKSGLASAHGLRKIIAAPALVDYRPLIDIPYFSSHSLFIITITFRL